jgi:hypothetical protein
MRRATRGNTGDFARTARNRTLASSQNRKAGFGDVKIMNRMQTIPNDRAEGFGSIYTKVKSIASEDKINI